MLAVDRRQPIARRSMSFDERDLMALAGDFSKRSGSFGAALGILYGLAVGSGARNMLEIGVSQGGSTRALLLAARRTGGHLTSIDIEDRTANVPADLRDRWTLLVGRSEAFATAAGARIEQGLDLLFIDGEHTYDVAAMELRTFGARVREGGLIVLDDCWSMFPGVRLAFDEYAAAAEKWLLPYGVPEILPGGRERTMGVIRKRGAA
jgi:predicted O-methyltransferase YrrM